MKDRKGNQSLKSCGLWLPGGVTWSGFACGGRRSSMWAVQLFLSGELVRAVVFEAGAPWCWWRCSLFACACSLCACAFLPVPALFWNGMCSSPSGSQDPGTEGETSSGSPCQVQLTHLLPASEAPRRILGLSNALQSS